MATTAHEEAPWRPCSPYAEAGGYVWLPRLLDKARRSRVGDLGDYVVFGASPLDVAAIAHFRQPKAQLLAWIDQGLSDEAIAEAIGAALGEDLAARRAWSGRFKLAWGLFMTGIDADEDRLPPGPATQLLKAMIGVVGGVVLALGSRRST